MSTSIQMILSSQHIVHLDFALIFSVCSFDLSRMQKFDAQIMNED